MNTETADNADTAAAPWRGGTLPVEDRVAALLSRMTLAEKIGQLQQTPMLGYLRREEEIKTGLRAGRWGSRILSNSAWAGSGLGTPLENPGILNELQRIAVEESRLGIPLIFGRDVIHGHATVLPIPLAQAASFDPDLIETASACVAREARAQGIHWSFAPMLDLSRDPRWGRVIEGYGEDPFLIARCGEAVIRGYQGRAPTDSATQEHMLACAKHFCGYGGSEGGRDYDTTEWSPHSLRNFVLPPFTAAIKAGVATVMSSFNDLGGTPVSGDAALMDRWLKQDQGFAGVVVSDWGSVADLVEHGVAADARAAAALGFNAGVDMEMDAEHLCEQHLPALLESGAVSPDRLDDAVRRILRMKFAAGLFENPYIDPALAPQVLRRSDHVETARRLAEESIVLLRNRRDLLPLRPADSARPLRLALVGPFAGARRQHLGAWCLDGRAEDVTSIHDGLLAAAADPAAPVALDIRTADPAFSDDMLAVAGAAGVDVIVACVGESPGRTGEGHGISTLELPPGQEQLIEALARLEKPLVVVQCSGRPLPSPAAERHADAWLLAWHGGTEAGPAIARILLGQVNPGGKLPMTMPRSAGQIPLYYNRKRPGKLRQMPHYRAYQDLAAGPLFPFGFGLSYTRFTWSAPALSATEAGVGDTVRASIHLKNIGPRAGSEVVQCYVQDPAAGTSRPDRELKAFRRVFLQPGESCEVTFALTPEHFGYFGADAVFRVDPGQFLIGLGPDSTVPLTARLELR